ncbi:MAG: hypothetical protein V4808_07050 [Pseudomonadota bacterium]
MPRPQTEADRLRQLNERFQRACHDNVTMAEAKRRIALDQIALKDRAIAALREGRSPVPSRPESQPQPEFWWNKGDLA